MRDNQNRQAELFGHPTMMPYRDRPTLTGGVMILSGNNVTSNLGCRNGLVTASPMIAPHSGARMRTANTGDLEGGFSFGDILKTVEDGVKLIPLKTRRKLSKKALEAIKNVDAKDIARLAGSGWFEDNILGTAKKLASYIPIDVRRNLTKSTVKFINALDADDVQALRGSGLCVAECKRRGKLEGGSFWSDIVKTVKKTVRKGVKAVKKGVKKYAPIVEKGVKDVAHEVKKDVEATVDLIPPKIRKAIKNKTIEIAPEVLSGALSAVAVASGQPELVPVAGIVGQVAGKAISNKLKGSGNGKRAIRASIVKDVMKKRGVKMIEASKIVKAEGLYKP
jgi:hypothetical protein